MTLSDTQAAHKMSLVKFDVTDESFTFKGL